MFTVSDECVRLGLRSGAVVFRNVRIEPAPPALRSEIAREVQAIRATFADSNAIRSLGEVVAFQEILKKVGVNPRKEQPSVERLLAGALKRGDLPTINSLVDAYNLISVRSLCSMGAHDLDTFTPPVVLRILNGRETFTPLGKTEPAPVTAGEFGYVDAAHRLLCRLDLLQADFSKVTTRTTNALLIIEGTAAHAPEKIQQTFSDAIGLITRYCDGTAEIVSSPV
jgi:DNA/RNA-binding domain of Phe-tRNA-synthetase-like protein